MYYFFNGHRNRAGIRINIFFETRILSTSWWVEIIIIMEGGEDGLMARMEVGEIVKRVKGLFEMNGASGKKARVLTTSGIMAELGIDARDLVRADLYNYIKGQLIAQGVRLPKHAHESVMDDFTQVFGERREDSVCEIKLIKKTAISLEEFREEEATKSGQVIDPNEKGESESDGSKVE